MTVNPPKITNAPGHTWNKRKYGWECRWQARTDLVNDGYLPKSLRIWSGPEKELTDAAIEFIQSRCHSMQDDMLAWRTGVPSASAYDGTIYSLAACYRTDPDSPYARKKLRHVTRQHYDSLIRRLEKDHAAELIEDIKARHLLRWHEEWSADGKISMGHGVLGMLRTLLSFGATILEDDECARLSAVLSKMRFPMGKARVDILTAEQACSIRALARSRDRSSISLAQAFQTDGILRQKDIIGERVPVSEAGVGIVYGNEKWMRGITWEEIDENLVLHHITSKRQKLVEPDLKNLSMVMEELRIVAGIAPDAVLSRSMLPASGPIIIFEKTGTPYTASLFRNEWRKIATLAGIPKTVRNMDSRAGAITEALAAGAPLDAVRKTATHSNSSMTQRYSRGDAEASAEVAQFRSAHRNKAGTPG